MTYDIDFFINKFEAIPELKWCVNIFNVGYKYCVQGHCGMTLENCCSVWNKELSEVPNHLHEAWFLVRILNIDNRNYAASINNGEAPGYKQPTPKQRILAALYDVKAQQAVNEAQNIIEQSKAKSNALA